MARNGSGTFTPSVDFTTEAASPPIEIAKLDTAITDVGDEITNSIAADGQTNPTANLPMNSFKHTGVGSAAARDQYASAADVQDQDLTYFVDSGAADAYVITPSPSIGAYEEGQRLVFRATNTNTGASTLNVNGLGTRAIQTPDGEALDAGAIVDGGIYEVTYDANTTPDRFVLTSPPSEIPDSMLSNNVPLLDAANVFTDNIRVSSLQPVYDLYDTNAGADEKLYRIRANGGFFYLESLTDAGGAGGTPIFITRTGTTIDEIQLEATLFDLIGNAQLSGSLTLGTDLAITEGGTGGSTASAARTNLGAQAQDDQLDDIAALAVTDGNFIVGNGTTFVAESGATARTSLGLGSMATVNSPVPVANGGTAATDAATARSNLGVPDTEIKFKTVGTSRSSTTTVTDDPHLAGFTVEAATYYMVEAFIIAVADNSATPDLRWQFQSSQTLQEGLAFRIDATESGGLGQTAISNNVGTANVVALTTGNFRTGLSIRGVFLGHATQDATVDFQWAQGTSDAAATTVGLGSWMKLTKMGTA